MNRHVLNFNNIPYFDGTSYKEDFIDLILNPGDYFAYTKIPESQFFFFFFEKQILE